MGKSSRIGLALLGAVLAVAAAGPQALARPAASPLAKALERFSAPGGRLLAPGETAAPRGSWNTATPGGLPGAGLAQRAMLVVGEGHNTMYLVRGGKVIWTYSTGVGMEYDDVWMLTNGNIVYTHQDYVAEITPEKKVVWRYDAPAGTEIHTAQPIGMDKVMFVLNGLPPRLMVVNTRTNRVEVDHALPATSLTDQKTVHGQVRRARYTAQGTYLVALKSMNRVVEYDRNFKEIWRHDITSPWAAVRLKNGDTLITDENDITTREVNARGQTVWELKPSDLPEAYRFINTQTATRLANGNTVICSRGGNGGGPQMVEVTPDKRVVWVLRDWATLGPVTAVQMLDEPGRPEVPGQSEH